MSHVVPMTCGGTRRGIRGVSRAGLFFFFARRRSRGGSRGERSRVARRRTNLAAREAAHGDDHRARRDEPRGSAPNREAFVRSRSRGAEWRRRGANARGRLAAAEGERASGKKTRTRAARSRRASPARCTRLGRSARQRPPTVLVVASLRARAGSSFVGMERRGAWARVAGDGWLRLRGARPGRSRASPRLRISARETRRLVKSRRRALLRAVRLADDARAARDADALFRAVLDAPRASLPAPLAGDGARGAAQLVREPAGVSSPPRASPGASPTPAAPRRRRAVRVPPRRRTPRGRLEPPPGLRVGRDGHPRVIGESRRPRARRAQTSRRRFSRVLLPRGPRPKGGGDFDARGIQVQTRPRGDALARPSNALDERRRRRRNGRRRVIGTPRRFLERRRFGEAGNSGQPTRRRFRAGV